MMAAAGEERDNLGHKWSHLRWSWRAWRHASGVFRAAHRRALGSVAEGQREGALRRGETGGRFPGALIGLHRKAIADGEMKARRLVHGWHAWTLHCKLDIKRVALAQKAAKARRRLGMRAMATAVSFGKARRPPSVPREATYLRRRQQASFVWWIHEVELASRLRSCRRLVVCRRTLDAFRRCAPPLPLVSMRSPRRRVLRRLETHASLSSRGLDALRARRLTAAMRVFRDMSPWERSNAAQTQFTRHGLLRAVSRFKYHAYARLRSREEQLLSSASFSRRARKNSLRRLAAWQAWCDSQRLSARLPSQAALQRWARAAGAARARGDWAARMVPAALRVGRCAKLERGWTRCLVACRLSIWWRAACHLAHVNWTARALRQSWAIFSTVDGPEHPEVAAVAGGAHATVGTMTASPPGTLGQHVAGTKPVSGPEEADRWPLPGHMASLGPVRMADLILARKIASKILRTEVAGLPLSPELSPVPMSVTAAARGPAYPGTGDLGAVHM